MENNTKKQSRGGSRPGSGRKKKEATETTSFRINSEALAICRKRYGRKINAKVNEFIKDLASTTPNTPNLLIRQK